jgi:hypothetical protein
MLISTYLLMAVLMGLSALRKGAIYPGIAGIVGPTLCLFAGSGLKGSLIDRNVITAIGGTGNVNRVYRSGPRNCLSLGLLGRSLWL